MTSSELSSNTLPLMMMSSEKVESNDDLLMRILIRLPLGLLYKLIWVSHRWKRIITSSSYFRTIYEARLRKQDRFPLLALIQTSTPPLIVPKRCARSGSHPPLMNILPVVPNHHNYVLSYVDPRYGFFFASSNGLVLTGVGGSHNTYYVMNLVTRWCSHPLHVPRPDPPKLNSSIFTPYNYPYKYPVMALVYEPDHEQVYRVLAVPTLLYPVTSHSIKIYSSNTREWTGTKLKAAQTFHISPRRFPIALNGFLHWLSLLPFCLVVVKTKDLIDSGETNVQLIMLPDIDVQTLDSLNFNWCRSSRDELWFGAIDDATSKWMRIWLLPERKTTTSTVVPNTEWILMHTIDLDSLRKDMSPLLLTTMPHFKKERHLQHQLETILSETIKLEALITWNDATFVLFRYRKSIVEDRIVLYELQSKSIELVKYVGTSNSDVSRYNGAYHWYPYIEPITMSSYFSNI